MNSQQIKQLADFLEEYIRENTNMKRDAYDTYMERPSAKDIELVLLKWVVDNTKS